ncbi:hypothetical protein [Pseudomonas sp. PD9R]|nr:hypothetical protein [Pseudomonas sp. PD9R]MBV6822135.1 hypothetical protein [Pseudomonas sp. PD9R]
MTTWQAKPNATNAMPWPHTKMSGVIGIAMDAMADRSFTPTTGNGFYDDC